MKYIIENNKILLNGLIFKFPCEVSEVLENHNYLIVLLKPKFNNNVYCLNIPDTEIAWKIDNTNAENCPITYMQIINGDLILSSSCSYILKVAITTGDIIFKKYDNAK